LKTSKDPSVTGAIADQTFRSNAGYELLAFDQLERHEKTALAEFINDSNYYGILRPRADATFTIKVVSRNVALLYISLKEPGKLPPYVKTLVGDRCNDQITQLIMDGVLEVHFDGRFVTGPEACKEILFDKVDCSSESCVGRLSRTALRYAIALDLDDALVLSTRLYCYNRIPVSQGWRRRLSTDLAVAEYLGLYEGTVTRRSLDRHWLPAETPAKPWLMWTARRSPAAAAGPEGRFKLYISPMPDDLPEALPLVIGALTEFEADSFKIGGDVFSLLRADKLIAYFPQGRNQLLACAYALVDRLAGCRAQGTPFTADITGTGILSWGVDPPTGSPTVYGKEGHSWRTFVAGRLASALLAGKSAHSSEKELLRYVFQRAKFDGIDAATWAPAANIWARR
jgi:hypothetical protein